ncbi:MAG: hypothetical protein H7842_09980 [Gammaproteobacteria bacterium SHHR-1]
MKPQKLSKTVSIRLAPKDYIELVAESETYKENLSDTLRRAWLIYKQERQAEAREQRLKQALFAISAEVANLSEQERAEAKAALRPFLG